MKPIPQRWHGQASAVASGILFLLSRDMGPFGTLALIAPVPLLLYALSADRWRPVAVWSLVTGFVARLSLLYAYITVFPTPILVLWLSVFAIWFMGILLATRWVARAGIAWATLVSYPLLTAASEFLFDSLSPHGSFGALGYSLAGLLPVLQLASLGGVPVLTFTAAFVPMAVTMLIAAPERRQVALMAGLPLAAAILFGVLRLGQGYDGEARVALAAIDALQDDEISSPTQAMDNAIRYADLAQTFAARRPDIILLPEKSLTRRAGWNDTGRPLQLAADRIGTPIVAGFIEGLENDRNANVAVLFRPQQAPLRYAKRRLIPGLEDEFDAGTDSLIVGDLGIAICKDMDFAAMIRDYGRRGVRLMLVPAWDFRADTDLHARMAAVRGVENGFAVIRTAANGLLTVNDAYGRRIAAVPSDPDRPVTLVANVGLTRAETVYARTGDAFGWLTLVAAILLIGWRVLSATRSRSAAR